MKVVGRVVALKAQVKTKRRAPVLNKILRRLDAFMQRSGLTLAELFAQVDVDGSGEVDVVEFRMGLASLGLLFDDASIGALVEVADTDGDGQLGAHEFCTRMETLLEQEATRPKVILSRLCMYLRNNEITPQALFEELDQDGTGDFDPTEFQRVLSHTGVRVSESAAIKAMAALDNDGNGTLETGELAQAAVEFQRQRRVWAATVLGNVCDYIKESHLSVQRVFANVDVDGSGNLDALELREAMLTLGQDLDELEAEEIMHELDVGKNSVTTTHFLDKLKQFESERIAATAKCAELFAKYDSDGSGFLERDEVGLLAGEMGLGEQVQDPAFLSKLITDIENIRRKLAEREDREQPQDDEEAGDGSVSYDELLLWFLCEGRSYLPPPSYPAFKNLEQMSQEDLSSLFDQIDEDHSGTISEQEALQAVAELYPYMGARLATIAFGAADRDGGGLIDVEEFAALFRCMIYLNARRHVTDDIIAQCDKTGVDDDSFYMACAMLNIEMGDAEASHCFNAVCRTSGFSVKNGLPVNQFLSWVVRRECIDALSSAEREEMNRQWMAAELDELTGEYGDIWFEDLASIVAQGIRREPQVVGQQRFEAKAKKNAFKSKLTKAAQDFSERLDLLSTAMMRTLKRTGGFPELPEEVVRSLINFSETQLFFAGQNIITQGVQDDAFFVIRRGMADVVVTRKDDDGVPQEFIVDTVRAGDGVGELGMLYGFKRTATVRCCGPCEVFVIRRANYETSNKLLKPEQRLGKLEAAIKQYWELVTGPAGSNRPSVDYAAYLKMSLRISKTLLSSEDGEGFDEEDERQIAQEDWANDVERYGLKVTDDLDFVSFCNSIYELVDTWAGDLNISFPKFLEQLFENIAEWCEEGYWGFKKLEQVQCDGESFDAIKEQAREEGAEAARQKKEARELWEQQHVRVEMRAQNRKARLEATRSSNTMLTDLRSQIVALDDEEKELRRRLAAGGLSAEEEEAIYRRLEEIQRERMQCTLRILDLQKAELSRKLESGTLSPEQEEECRRMLAALDTASFNARLGALDAEEALLKRRLASGNLTAAEEAKLRRRLEEIAQERLRILSEKLDAEEAEMNRRLNSGTLTAAEQEGAKRRLADIAQERVQLKIDAIQAEEAELRRRLASGKLSPAEEEAVRARLAALEQESIKLNIEKLELEASELRRRLDSGALSAKEQELTRRRLAQLGMKCVELKLDALAAEETELHRLLSSGNLSEIEERKLRDRLGAIAQHRVSLQIQAAEQERTELERRCASGTLSAAEKEAARLRLQSLDGLLAELQTKAAELCQQAADAQTERTPCLSSGYQPVRVAPRTPGAVFASGGWAETAFVVDPAGQPELEPDRTKAAQPNGTRILSSLHHRHHASPGGSFGSPVAETYGDAGATLTVQQGTKLRPQKQQLDNFSALLSGPDGQATLRQSFESAQITVSVKTTMSLRNAGLRRGDASSSQPVPLHQTHLFAHTQDKTPGGRLAYPAAGLSKRSKDPRQLKRASVKHTSRGTRKGATSTFAASRATGFLPELSSARCGRSQSRNLSRSRSLSPIQYGATHSRHSVHGGRTSPTYQDYSHQEQWKQQQSPHSAAGVHASGSKITVRR